MCHLVFMYTDTVKRHNREYVSGFLKGNDEKLVYSDALLKDVRELTPDTITIVGDISVLTVSEFLKTRLIRGEFNLSEKFSNPKIFIQHFEKYLPQSSPSDNNPRVLELSTLNIYLIPVT